MLIQQFEQIVNALPAKGPMATCLTQSQEPLQNTLECSLAVLGLGLVRREHALCFIHEGVILLLLSGEELDTVQHHLLGWQFEVHEFHILVSTKTEVFHESLEKDFGASVAFFDAARDESVEDFLLLDTSCDLQKVDQGVEVLDVVDTGTLLADACCGNKEQGLHRGSSENPTRLGVELVDVLSCLGTMIANGVTFVQNNASPLDPCQNTFREGSIDSAIACYNHAELRQSRGSDTVRPLAMIDQD